MLMNYDGLPAVNAAVNVAISRITAHRNPTNVSFVLMVELTKF